jgi:16S rRNA (guanine527-N7)-methyltransferase
MNPGIELITHYFPGLSKSQLEQFDRLLPLYNEWNEKINVISRKDIEHLYERHVLHSLGIAKIVSFAEGTRVIDAGTGGGFPGIPLAIFFPQAKFHLVDSIGKKIKVVNEIAQSLGLQNVTAEYGRVESIKQKFDFAVSRAVAPLSEMLGWLDPLVAKGNKSSLANGMLFLKGGDLSDEIINSGRKATVFEVKNFFEEDFFAEKSIIYLAGNCRLNKGSY